MTICACILTFGLCCRGLDIRMDLGTSRTYARLPSVTGDDRAGARPAAMAWTAGLMQAAASAATSLRGALGLFERRPRWFGSGG